MSKELIERLHKHRPGKGDLDDEAANCIESLRRNDVLNQQVIADLRAKLKEAQAAAAHWKNNHETEVRRARILKERTDMPIERVDAYEQWGKDQMALKEAQAEIEQWKARAKIEERASGWCAHKDEADCLRTQLAASQANEVQLRDGIKNLGELAQALDSCGSVADSPKSVWAQSEVMTEFAQKLLSLPSDTTALEAMIKKAGEVMRERCAEWLDERVYYRRESEAIRAIPGVTLEDLK